MMTSPFDQPITRALISVSNKTGIVKFALALQNAGVEILSTGGTATHLMDNGVRVIQVANYTEFPELFDGRVKTLHPKIHGGILQRRDNEEDQAEAKEHNIAPVDLVVVSLYPFEMTVLKPGVSDAEVIENIDIGGPSMLRSAAKNHKWVTVLCDHTQYDSCIEQMHLNGGATNLEFRRAGARNAFAHTQHYDAAIEEYFAQTF